MKSKLLKVLTISFVVFLYSVNTAQDFTINVHDTYIIDTLGSEIVFTIDLTNNSNQEMGVTVVRNEIDFPNGWSSSLCFDRCFAPHLDSISTSSDYGSAPLSAGESREMSLHVFPLDRDSVANIELKFVNEENSSEQYIVGFLAATIIISVDDESSKISNYKLSQNYPNPFNPSTIINYSIGAQNSSSEFVSLKVFDVLGREVATLVNQQQNAGSYSVKFNSDKLTSGIYFYELKTDNFHQINKMILEK